jgi:hypothetical protein
LEIAEDDFYDENPPNELQQGDVLVGTPLFLLPKGEELLVLRTPMSRTRLEELPNGLVQVVREKAIGDAFDAPEYVGVPTARVAAVLMTQTCDIGRTDFWLVSILDRLNPVEVDRGNLYAGKYKSLFPYPKHDHFEESLIDIVELHTIRCDNVGLGNRVASVKPAIQRLLSDKFLHAMGRRWGYAHNEEIPADGKYRCLGCNDFDMPVCEPSFTKGEKFPECVRCSSVRRPTQWYPLQKPKEKQLKAGPPKV